MERKSRPGSPCAPAFSSSFIPMPTAAPRRPSCLGCSRRCSSRLVEKMAGSATIPLEKVDQTRYGREPLAWGDSDEDRARPVRQLTAALPVACCDRVLLLGLGSCRSRGGTRGASCRGSDRHRIHRLPHV